MFSIWCPNESSFSHTASTNAQRPRTVEYDVIFQAELIVPGARFSRSGCNRTLLCNTMQPQVPGKALMKSYENLDASWLRRDGWKMGTEHGRVKREA